MNADLTGKTVIVEGASGAGLALAHLASERGAGVHIVDRDLAKLEATQASVGAKATVHQADITIESEGRPPLPASSAPWTIWSRPQRTLHSSPS